MRRSVRSMQAPQKEGALISRPNLRGVSTVDELESASIATADLSDPAFKLAGEACCDQCCDDYVCSSD